MSLRPGDRIPNFQLPALDGLGRVFYFEVTGGPILMFAARTGAIGAAAAVREIAGQSSALAQCGAEIMAVLGDLALAGDQSVPGVMFEDREGKLLDLLLPGAAGAGAGADMAFLVLDANQRLLRTIVVMEPGAGVGQALRALKDHAERPLPPPATLQYGAPALLMENLLDAETCERLIESWRRDHREGLVNDGQVNAPDAKIKKNREHEVVDPDLRKMVANTIGPRIGGELEKAFNYSKPLRFEAFTVLSYTDERRDFFAPHRDNLRATQKRRFAMSLNLNDGYEGGELWFPEYGRHKYLPPAGAGVIFSCALLHEALPVTKGQRWVMVTFMCD